MRFFVLVLVRLRIILLIVMLYCVGVFLIENMLYGRLLSGNGVFVEFVEGIQFVIKVIVIVLFFFWCVIEFFFDVSLVIDVVVL